MLPVCLFCYFGGQITQRFEDVGDVVYQMVWYKFPLDMQKDFGLMILCSKKRIYMQGYGNFRTTHSVFKKVNMRVHDSK